MKTQMQKQRGFFDMGISLIILAVGSTTAVVATSNHETTVAQEQPTMTSGATPRQTLIGYDIDS